MKKICMILVLCLVAIGVYGQDDVDRTLLVNIKAMGLDADIPGFGTSTYTADTLIVGKIEFDEVSELTLGQVEFHLTIYDVSGEKVYSMKGHLENAAVMMVPLWPCYVRDVTWTDVWLVMGQGRVKTTDVVIDNFEYRENFITLPNTEGKYEERTIVMMVSPNGETLEGEPWGGWAFAGIQGFGGITYLTKYMEKWVP